MAVDHLLCTDTAVTGTTCCSGSLQASEGGPRWWVVQGPVGQVPGQHRDGEMHRCVQDEGLGLAFKKGAGHGLAERGQEAL